MYYAYILLSSKSHIFYFGSAKDLKLRFKQHNNGEVKSTKPHLPWKLVRYAGFETEKQARDFEQYLKSGSGKAFTYKRLVSVALAKDLLSGRKSSPKSRYSEAERRISKWRIPSVRGPSRYAVALWRYANALDGSLDRFSGTEVIFLGKDEVYRCWYHGGSLDKLVPSSSQTPSKLTNILL